MIDRRNIIELIGKHRGKYHSCVITCYSLDFSFFEERILPALRIANVKNVNILADGHYLEKAQEITTGKEFKHNKTYNFLPIYETGVFHPKIILLTGVKHGLLIIGSGNITSSGLSTNDEIWGAFHLDNIGNENAPLFGAVWSYLQTYLKQSLGFVQQKIEWIHKHSPWLNELPISYDWINLTSLGNTVKFIANSNEQSSFKKLVDSLPENGIEELTIVSPYFDKSGSQLIQFINQFNPSKVNCLIDSISGTIPSEINAQIASQINFYNWSDCRGDFDSIYNRLHAKIFHFKTIEEEYLLIGSANATSAALGTIESLAKNGEAGVLLKRPLAEKTWLDELKIELPNTTIDIQKTSIKSSLQASIKKIQHKFRIKYSELRSSELTIYLNVDCTEKIELLVIDRNDSSMEYSIKEIKGDTLTVLITDPDKAFKVSIVENEERISNYSIIHRLELLLRCNPDPKQEKLDALLEQEYTDSEGITDLLQFVDYHWADEDTNQSFKTSMNNGSFSNIKHDSKEEQKAYEILKAEEFNKISNESLLKQSGELSNSTVKIADFLSLYAAGTFNKEDLFSESEEQKLFEDEEQLGVGGEIVSKKSVRTNGSKEKNAIIGYFKKLNELYDNQLKTFYQSSVIKDLPTNQMNVRSISSILIAMHLILVKYGKRFTSITLNQGSKEEVNKEEVYISVGSDYSTTDSIKGFLMNVFGKYLLISSAGYKQYDYDVLNQKMDTNRYQILLKSIFIILNLPWREKETTNKKLLLLNSLYFTLGSKLLFDNHASKLIKSLQEVRLKSNYVVSEFDKNMNDFSENLLPFYIEWLSKFDDQDKNRKLLVKLTSDLTLGDLIFNSKIGFNEVKRVNNIDNKNLLILNRPGYLFTEGKFEIKNIQFGSLSISYND